MNRREAFEVLGCAHGDGENVVRAAYSEQVRRNHPDHGGDGKKLARLKAARDILLTTRGKVDCSICHGNGYVRRPGKLTRTSCPRGCKAD